QFNNTPALVLEALVTDTALRNASQKTALIEWYRSQFAPELKVERERHAELEKLIAKVEPSTVPIMKEQEPQKKRKTFVQLRGNFRVLSEEVSEGVPAVFPPLPAGAAPDRLALARWLVDENNPLTTRVIANRFWEQIFGAGIVR